MSDFYAAYNFCDGPKQRCWVHLYRALKESAKAEHTELERSRLKACFELELFGTLQALYRLKTAVQRVLAERMEHFIGELLTFVANPAVPSENNAAERAVRPAVVDRKVSGGSQVGTRLEDPQYSADTLRDLGNVGAQHHRCCREMITASASTQPASPRTQADVCAQGFL